MELLSLSEYTQIAKSFISKYGDHRWLRNDEYIYIVVNNLIRSDRKYDAEKGTTLNTFRVNGFKNSRKKIYRVMKECYSRRSIYDGEDLDREDGEESKREISNTVKEILSDNNTLTSLDQKYLHMVFQQGMKMSEVANEFGVTRQAVSVKISVAISKLRKLYGTE
jgi:RNA polymerase sigma factor (sigma-70 family)